MAVFPNITEIIIWIIFITVQSVAGIMLLKTLYDYYKFKRNKYGLFKDPAEFITKSDKELYLLYSKFRKRKNLPKILFSEYASDIALLTLDICASDPAFLRETQINVYDQIAMGVNIELKHSVRVVGYGKTVKLAFYSLFNGADTAYINILEDDYYNVCGLKCKKYGSMYYCIITLSKV